MYLDRMGRIPLLGDLRAAMKGSQLVIARFQTAKTGSLFAYLADTFGLLRWQNPKSGK